MAYVQEIAEKIILRTDTEKGDVISNLKLQKLIYYVQGYHLAFFNKPLFSENLQAWTYGPVAPEVYRRFKDSKASGIIIDPIITNEIKLNSEQEDMFNQVMHEYGKFSALRLMEMTHTETPWKEAYEKADKIISLDTMQKFFKNLTENE